MQSWNYGTCSDFRCLFDILWDFAWQFVFAANYASRLFRWRGFRTRMGRNHSAKSFSEKMVSVIGLGFQKLCFCWPSLHTLRAETVVGVLPRTFKLEFWKMFRFPMFIGHLVGFCLVIRSCGPVRQSLVSAARVAHADGEQSFRTVIV